MKGISFLLDLLYPPRCAFCHDFLETSREGVCAHCRTGLPFAQNGGRQHFPFIPACVSPLNYEGNVRESLLRYKFGGATGYAKVYGRLVAETVRTELPGAYDIVTWVPLSRKRLRERGYDQARLLAKATAKALGMPLTPTLYKQRNTQPQSGTGDAAKRRANITGAYRMKKGCGCDGKARPAHRRHRHDRLHALGVRACARQSGCGAGRLRHGRALGRLKQPRDGYD